MEKKINEIKNGEKELVVSLTIDEIKPDLEAAYKKERKHINIDGFRKGKVPIAMVKKLFGEAIEYKASEDIANKKYWDIVQSDDLKPISTPKLIDLDYKPNEGLSFKIQYEVIPELELKDYTGQEIEKPIFKVKDEDIQKDIDQLLKAHATFEEAEKVESEDYKITVDLTKLDDNDELVENSTSNDMQIDLSDDRVNSAIKDNAQGKVVNDKFRFTFVDEHNHGEEVHKTEYKYEALVKKIEKIVPPEITEELIKKVSNDKASTLDEFKKQMKDDYESYFNSQAENMFTNSLLGKVVENNNIEATQGYVEVLQERFLAYEKEQAKQKKAPFDENKVKAELLPKAEWNAKWRIFLENITRIEKITVAEEDLKKIAEEEAGKTGISVDKLMKYYKDSGREESLLEEKVIDFLKANNVAKEVDPRENKKEEEK